MLDIIFSIIAYVGGSFVAASGLTHDVRDFALTWFGFLFMGAAFAFS